MTVCNRCGKENQDHYKFCLGCGAELTAAPKPGGDMAMMKTMMADTGAPGGPLAGMVGPGGWPDPAARERRAARGCCADRPAAAPSRCRAAAPARCRACRRPARSVGPRCSRWGRPAARRCLRRCSRWARRPASRGSRRGSRRRPAARRHAALPVVRQRRPADLPVLRHLRIPHGRGLGAGADARPPGPIGAPVARSAALSMTLIRPDGTEGGTHDLRPGENKLGRSFGPVFENDGYLSPIHAQLDIRGGSAVVRDLDSLNGVFVKMTQRGGADQSGQIIRIGQELLRFEVIADARADRRRHRADGQPEPGLLGQADRDHRPRHHRRGVPAARRQLSRSAASAARSTSPTTATSPACTPGSRCATAACSWPTSAARTARSSRSTASAPIGHESFVLLGQQLFRLNLA